MYQQWLFSTVAGLIFTLSTVATATPKFRNHPDVLGKPMICSILLAENTATPAQDSNAALSRVLDQFAAGTPYILNGQPAAGDAEEMAYMNDLFFEVSRVLPDKISWGHMTVGHAAIRTQLERRIEIAEDIKREVSSRLAVVHPEIRKSHAAILTAVLTLTGVPLAGVIDGLINASPAIAAASVMAGGIFSYLGREIYWEQGRQVGVWPVNVGSPDPYYEADFIPHTRSVLRSLESGQLGVQSFRSGTHISYVHFKVLGDCQNESRNELITSTMVSCVFKRVNPMDLTSPYVANLVNSQKQAEILDRRWAYPGVQVDEIFDYTTSGEPVLLTYVRLFARKIPEAKPPKKAKEEEQTLGYDEKLIPIPIRR